MITTRDPTRAIRELRHGETVVLEVAPGDVAAYEKALDENIRGSARARIRVKGSEAAARAGCITLRTTRAGVQVGLYRAREAGLEDDPEAPYATVCEAHGAIVLHATRRDGERSLPYPEGWCDDCRGTRT